MTNVTGYVRVCYPVANDGWAYWKSNAFLFIHPPGLVVYNSLADGIPIFEKNILG
ncbi:MAG: hypothetical protein QM654_03320 [Dysgonamonadaceae bacterium]